MNLNETGHPVIVEGKLHNNNYVWASDYYIERGYMGPKHRGMMDKAGSTRTSVQGKAIQVKHSTKCS